MREIAAVTVGRSDFGLYGPMLRAIDANPELGLRLLVVGMHLEDRFGSTVGEVEESGHEIGARIELGLDDDSPGGIVRSMGRAVEGFGRALDADAPDVLLTLGDRFETHAAGLAALPFRIPVAHIHGGELTEGAIDDSLRHSLTKLSHLHFASTEAHARRIVQMGEEPWRVTVSGAPGLDAIAELEPLGLDELHGEFGISLERPTLLVTFHPVTLEFDQAPDQAAALLSALARVDMNAVITAPNADTAGREIAGAIERFAAGEARATYVPSLGSRAYLTLMRHAAALVGNSSSGIIEAASFEVPVVNVGNRQRGRLRAGNVIDVPAEADAIAAAVERAVSPEFRGTLEGMANPYGDGHAAERIVARLAEVELGSGLVTKRFYDADPR